MLYTLRIHVNVNFCCYDTLPVFLDFFVILRLLLAGLHIDADNIIKILQNGIYSTCMVTVLQMS